MPYQRSESRSPFLHMRSQPVDRHTQASVLSPLENQPSDWSPVLVNSLFPLDSAGDSIATARDIRFLWGAQNFSDFVGSGDEHDIYQFQLAESGVFLMALSRLTADADVSLMQDINNNGLIEQDEILGESDRAGTASESFLTNLDAGTYYVRVSRFSGDTNYNLLLATSASPPDNAGNSIATARDIGVLSGSQTFSDFVGDSDEQDIYRFQLTQSGEFQLTLDGLTADADVMLIRDANNNGLIDQDEILSESDRAGTSSENLSGTLDAGTYYIRVFQFSGDTDYDLTLATSAQQQYSFDYGYGLVDAAAAVASATGSIPFPQAPDLGGESWNLDQINAPEVWQQGVTGNGIVVAVVDTGIDYTHADLDDNIWVNAGELAGNGVDDDGNGYVDDIIGWNFVDGTNNPMDGDGHGTHVAGTIAAENNGFGSTGVAYDAKIMPVKVLDDLGSGTGGAVSDGIYYAVNNGADIINLSLGGGYISSVVDAVTYAVQQGAVVVMAAGNDGSAEPGYPAHIADEWGIAVGAIDYYHQLADFSNRAGFFLNYVDAPGVDIYSTTPDNTYQFFNGTSMATPHVAGVAALVLSANSSLTPNQVEAILTQTANFNGVIV